MFQCEILLNDEDQDASQEELMNSLLDPSHPVGYLMSSKVRLNKILHIFHLYVLMASTCVGLFITLGLGH